MNLHLQSVVLLAGLALCAGAEVDAGARGLLEDGFAAFGGFGKEHKKEEVVRLGDAGSLEAEGGLGEYDEANYNLKQQQQQQQSVSPFFGVVPFFGGAQGGAGGALVGAQTAQGYPGTGQTKMVASPDMWAQMHSGLSELISGKKGAPLIQIPLFKSPEPAREPRPTPPTQVIVREEERKDVFKLMSEWTKLMFNPFELVKSISRHFRLPFDKFTERLGTGMVSGVETVTHPLLVTIKIIERVFKPDHCRLKFMCRIGGHLNFIRTSVLKFSPQFLEGSHHLKALTDGIAGRDCELAFPNCEPRLRKPFEELRSEGRAMGEVKGVAGEQPTATGAPVVATGSGAPGGSMVKDEAASGAAAPQAPASSTSKSS